MSDTERERFLTLGERDRCTPVFNSGLASLNKGSCGGDGGGFDELYKTHPDTVQKLAKLERQGTFSERDIRRIDDGLQSGDLNGQSLNRLVKMFETPNSKHMDNGGGEGYDGITNKLRDRGDWDHTVLGSNRKEMRSRISKVLDSPDAIYKDSKKDRWMFVKSFQIDGKRVTVTLFFQNQDLRSVFAPTLREIDGPQGHTRTRVREFIRNQGMIKYLEDSDTYVPLPEVDVGEEP